MSFRKIELAQSLAAKYQWLGFQPDQYWRLIPPGVVRAQWFVTQLLRNTLVGLASASMVAGVDPV
jgi:hypothetical protein